jgi:hypothetical protein
MDMQIIIKQMCKSELNDSDLKAVCKSRGFPANGATSREILKLLHLNDGHTGSIELIDLWGFFLLSGKS